MGNRPLPPPRGDRRLCDLLRARIEEFPGSIIEWSALTARGYDSWFGASLPDIGFHDRRWSFDVVNPGEAADDLLALEIEHDLVEVVVWDRSRPRVRGRLVTERPDGVTEISVPASAWPPAPWRVEIDLGWSMRRVSDGIGEWIDRFTARHDVLVINTNDDSTGATVRPISGLVQATDAAFDELLAMDPADAAVICNTLSAVAEALAA